jgi:cold shock protein
LASCALGPRLSSTPIVASSTQIRAGSILAKTPSVSGLIIPSRSRGSTALASSENGGTEMAIGTVKFFNTERGFGFIQPDDRTADTFVHISDIQAAGIGEIREGDRLEYELEADKRSGKRRAVRLKTAG